ncbi:MAG: GIY-YIG nuclease family protein [Caulobacter sp.]|nr:GIY-YIG nuclease family protein [Caulobacter sp.]
MNRDRKRELTSAYKERKARPGVFAIRCAASGEVWIGSSRELHNRQNGFWMGLRMGGHPKKALQAAWKAHGEASFSYEELDELDAEGLEGWSLDLALKARAAEWRERLGAAEL